ncbi:MAG: NYN domain-containing protein, partial [Verrucomicrobiae bacterium]|nr:NYN domain-containing protein [Verrucomicrobiae bacterium]
RRWVLVDGYSVLHQWPRLRKIAGRSLEQRRNALLALLERYADHSGHRVTVVFDAYAARHQTETCDRFRGVEVIYSSRGRTADAVIARMVGESRQPALILVVTSDNVERRVVESLGAQSVSAEFFELELDAGLRELERVIQRHSPNRLP